MMTKTPMVWISERESRRPLSPALCWLALGLLMFSFTGCARRSAMRPPDPGGVRVDVMRPVPTEPGANVHIRGPFSARRGPRQAALATPELTLQATEDDLPLSAEATTPE